MPTKHHYTLVIGYHIHSHTFLYEYLKLRNLDLIDAFLEGSKSKITKMVASNEIYSGCEWNMHFVFIQMYQILISKNAWLYDYSLLRNVSSVVGQIIAITFHHVITLSSTYLYDKLWSTAAQC